MYNSTNKIKSLVGLGLLLALVNSQAAAPAAPQGFITVKEFLNIGGGVTIPDLTNNAKFPNNPDLLEYPARFEWPTGPDDATPPTGDVKNNYGIQILGYFYPATTGPHTFWLAADDGAVLYLSTDDNPANKVLIAQEPTWNPVRAFTAESRRTLVDVGTATERYINVSRPINLTAGRAYYIEGLVKEGIGGDNIAVSIDSTLPIPGSMLATIDKTSGPVSITTQPASQTVAEGTPVTFSVVANGTPPFSYQWKRAGTDIANATGASHTIPFAPASDNNVAFTVVVTGGQGAPVTSAPATLTVTPDTTRPTVVEAFGSSDFTHVTINFSERVDATTAATTGNYAINDGVTVTAARALSDTSVELTTSRQTGGRAYTLTINNVRDRATTPNVITANSQVTFNSAVFKTGIANWQRWNNLDGDTADIDTFVANLADPNFRAPDASGILAYLGTPRGAADNYGARAFAYFVPPSTGNYVFFLACDDQGYLFLSTTDNPAGKLKIAAQPAWSDQNQWNDPDTTDVRSDQYTATEWPTGNTITLTNGVRYYIEMAFREGGGGDGGEVFYKLATAADPANGTAPNTTGNVIGSFVDPASLPPVITTRPAGVLFRAGETVRLSVAVESAKAVTYQWYRSKRPIPGATNAVLEYVNANHVAIGDYYVEVSNANGMVSSYPDDDARVLMRGAFLIEAEDFNYEGGKWKPEANVMPYVGNAYTNLTAVQDVDFNNDGDESGGAAFAYSRFVVEDANVLEFKGGLASQGADPVQNQLNRQRGDFEVIANYASGWTDAADWQNYTRVFSNGTYVIYGAVAHDGRAANEINMVMSQVARPTATDGSSPGTEGGQQGLTRLGHFLNPATGAWSSNDLVPLTDDSGNIVHVQLGGTNTLRLTFNAADGDADYFLLYAVTEGGDDDVEITSITRSGANVTINWTGGGTLESTTALGPGATWTTTGDSDGSYTTAVGTGNMFFRVRK
jgi:hypothetical protein